MSVCWQSPFYETVLERSFAGLRETHSALFGLDGMDYTTSIPGVQRVSPSQDWVLKLRVTTSAYTADNGQNLFNRQDGNGIDTLYGAPAFPGQVPEKSGDGINSPANPTFGTPSFVIPARQVQLTLRLNL